MFSSSCCRNETPVDEDDLAEPGGGGGLLRVPLGARVPAAAAPTVPPPARSAAPAAPQGGRGLPALPGLQPLLQPLPLPLPHQARRLVLSPAEPTQAQGTPGATAASYCPTGTTR